MWTDCQAILLWSFSSSCYFLRPTFGALQCSIMWWASDELDAASEVLPVASVGCFPAFIWTHFTVTWVLDTALCNNHVYIQTGRSSCSHDTRLPTLLLQRLSRLCLSFPDVRSVVRVVLYCRSTDQRGRPSVHEENLAAFCSITKLTLVHEPRRNSILALSDFLNLWV